MCDDNEVQRTLGRLEAKVDILMERSAEAAAAREAIGKRITVLEHAATFQRGIVAVIGAVAGVISAAASKLFGVT